MAKYDLKIKALALRRSGMSIGNVAKTLSISKGTASIWCRDVVLTKSQKETILRNAWIAGNEGRLRGARANKDKKLKNIAECQLWAKNASGDFSKRDLLIAGVALYWAEGSKKNSSGFMFVNSDPIMISFMHEWLRKIMGVKEEDIMPRLAINEIHKPRIKKVLKFWSQLLNVPVDRFGNPWYVAVKQKKVYDNYDNYYGVLRLRVAKSGILKYKMLSLIEILGSHYKLPR